MPKPFPYPFQIGIDICIWPRIRQIILKTRDNPQHLDKWASKFLVRSERETFNEYFKKWDADGDRLRLNRLAVWTAGRWAAKEAAIKAHPDRKLVMKQVEIVTATNNLPDPVDEETEKSFHACSRSMSASSQSPIALISPTKRYILMDENVAKERGLNLTFPTKSETNRDHFRAYCKQAGLPKSYADSAKIHKRSAIHDDNDIQEAKISISHDGEYATAVCIAVDAGEPSYPDVTIDAGAGPPMHSPLDSDLKQDPNFYMEDGDDGPPESSIGGGAMQHSIMLGRQNGMEDAVTGHERIRGKGPAKVPSLESSEALDAIPKVTSNNAEDPKEATFDLDALESPLPPDAGRGQEDEVHLAGKDQAEHHRPKKDRIEPLALEEEPSVQPTNVEAEEEIPKSGKKLAKTTSPTKKRGRGRPKKVADEQRDEEEEEEEEADADGG